MENLAQGNCPDPNRKYKAAISWTATLRGLFDWIKKNVQEFNDKENNKKI